MEQTTQPSLVGMRDSLLQEKLFKMWEKVGVSQMKSERNEGS